MIVTGAFLAEAAATVDNKLHVWGGVPETFFVGPDRFARFFLVVLLQHGADKRDDVIQLTLIPPPEQEERLEIPIRLPPGAIGGEVAHAWFPIQISLPFDGRYGCLVTTGGTTISLPMNVQPIPQQ